jgi:ectoine hydroxylase-related dioxygenase (phytanoyl-CoA dioxygenase family)
MTTQTPSTLSTTQIDEYRRNGCITLRNVLTDEQLAVVQRVAADAKQRGEFAPPTEGTMAYQGSREFTRSIQLMRNLTYAYPDLREVAMSLGPIGRDLIGESVRFFSDRIFTKPTAADEGMPTQWHQDFPKIPTDRRGFMTLWIAVEQVTLEHGPLSFVPGSHRLGPLGGATPGLRAKSRDEVLRSLMREDDLPFVGDVVQTALEPGDATVHDGLMLHSAAQNTASTPRVAWTVSFIPASALYTGAAQSQTDDLGLTPWEVFDHELFPVVA